MSHAGPFPKILLAGAPRTGSTWIAKYLNQSRELVYNHEPDNEMEAIGAEYHKTNLPRFPYLNENSEAPSYQNLFTRAFARLLKANDKPLNLFLMEHLGTGRKQKIQNLQQNLVASKEHCKHLLWASRMLSGPIPNGKAVLVKSVHAPLSLPFIHEKLEPQVVLIFRNPLDAYGSQVKLKMKDQNRQVFLYHPRTKSDRTYLQQQPSAFQAGLQMGLFYQEMTTFSQKQKHTQVLFYEEIVKSPQILPNLAAQLGLQETPVMKAFLDKNNRSGRGYQTARELKKQINTHLAILTSYEIQQFRAGYLHINPPVYQNI